MRAMSFSHQYIERETMEVVTEKPIGDRTVQFLYNNLRENAPVMFRALTSGRMSSLLGFFHYDIPGKPQSRGQKIFERHGVDWRECVKSLDNFDSARKFFERQIRFWENRPMENCQEAIVSPADSRILIGSFTETSSLFIKSSFFDLEELLGDREGIHQKFSGGEFAVCRLTPDKYHYNHLPVSGKVIDFYHVDGQYHSCNPSAQIAVASIYSKNRRVVTLIDTDVPGGTKVGVVAMVEIVAMMIGDISQCYCEHQYFFPREIKPGMFVKKGCPKSLFRPGSSTDVLIFEPGRIRFSDDLISNSKRQDILTRFTCGRGKPLVETDVQVRSTIAHKL